MVRYTKRFLKRIFIAGLLLVIALGVLAYYYRSPVKVVDVPLTSLQDQLDITRLDNGLTVTIKETHALPLVTIQFWIHVGAKNEPEKYKGIAHIFEHIWFKGTPTQPVGSFHKRVESLGGELNAMTSHDWTMYFVTVPSDKFDDIFPYMTDLLFNPAFDEKEIEKEKQVILEEQRFSFNEPERYLDDQFGLLLIDKHPYRNPIIGYKNTITAPSREDIITFYKTWYVPNNMNVVIVGDVKKDEMLEKIKTAFAEFKPAELPTLDLPKEKPITEPKYNSSLRDIGYTYIAIGYTGPSSKEEDNYAMLVLNTIFATGDSSRLQQIVKQQKNLITRGNSVFVALNDLGVFETVVVTDPEKAGQTKTELILQLNRFKTEYVTDEELEKAKMTIRTNKVKSQEEIFQVGMDVGESWINDEDYTKIIEKINAVTKEDIKQAAQKYFTAYTIYELKPKL